MSKSTSTWFLLLLVLQQTHAIFSPIATLHQIRQQLLARQEFIINAVVGGVLFSASDILAQRIEQCNKTTGNQENQVGIVQQVWNTDRALFCKSVDWKRCTTASVVGACLSCGLYPAAYKTIDKIWKHRDLVSLIQKSAIEIVTVGVAANSFSMLVRGLAPGGKKHSLPQVLRHMKEEISEVTVVDFKLFFPYNMVAFTFVPTQLRPLTTMVIETIWQTYMSLHSNNYDSEDVAIHKRVASSM